MANIALLIVEAWLLGGIVLLLHYLTPRYGFAPLLLFIGGLTVIVQSQFGIFVELAPGFLLFVSSNVLVPVVLLAVLVIYVAEGAIPARMTIFGILGISVMVLAALYFYRLYLALPGGGTTTGLTPDQLIQPINPRITIGSLIAFAADMFVIAVVYQGMKNIAPRLKEWVIVGAALLLGLWTDAIVFRIFADLGTDDFIALMPADVLGKTISALILWPLAGFYLTRVAPRLPDYVGGLGRPTFDLLFGSFEAVKMALIHTEAALQKSELKRQEQEAYNRQLADHIEEGLWLADPNHNRIFYVNPAYEQMMECSAASLYTDPATWSRRIHPEDRARIVAGLPNRISGHYDVEYRIVLEDGSVRWLRDRAFPIRNSDDIVYRIAGITEDITGRKESEKQALELGVEREKVKLLRDFISETSHDLKSPLTSINMKIYQLGRVTDEEKRSRHLAELAQISGRMSQMIDDLLTLARLENIHESSFSAVDLNYVIQEICAMRQPLIEEKGLQLRLELADVKPVVQGDSADLARALANLLDNAVRYTPDGGEITILTEAEQKAIRVQVRDTGIGINGDDLPHIFERFFRANGVDRPEGIGLGLAITRKIVERHGGSIQVNSAPGEGTSFTVSLPC